MCSLILSLSPKKIHFPRKTTSNFLVFFLHDANSKLQASTLDHFQLEPRWRVFHHVFEHNYDRKHWHSFQKYLSLFHDSSEQTKFSSPTLRFTLSPRVREGSLLSFQHRFAHLSMKSSHPKTHKPILPVGGWCASTQQGKRNLGRLTGHSG